MNGYFLHIDLSREIGVNKKISYQFKELRKTSNVYEITIETTSSILFRILSRFPFFYPSRYLYSTVLEKIENPNYLYIRKNMLFDRYFMFFLKKIKKSYPNCKILVEIPTYPYFKESLLSISSLPLVLRDFFYSFFCYKYIDRIVTYSMHDRIFSTKTINIMNGIDLDKVKEKKPSNCYGVITLIAVAMFSPWHGYERLIKGLNEYKKMNGTRNVRFILVGNGPELVFYRSLVKQFKLENEVIFKGILKGESLDKVYDEADIGLGVFGMYKKNMLYSSALKTREYLCKGLPVVSGCKEDVLVKYQNDYYLEFENNCSPVDISKIIDFYDRLFGNVGNCIESKLNVIKNVRYFANRYTSMENSFFPVISFLNE